MSVRDQAGVLVTLDVVVPRLASDGSWEVVFIQRNKEPYKGMWALPGGHLNVEDASLQDAARREVLEETGLEIPLDLFEQVYTFEDFEDSRGKYLCLLYVLSQPLSLSATIQAGDDASHVQWLSVENLGSLPELAFNHIRLLRMGLFQMFTSQYHVALGLQPLTGIHQCEVEVLPGKRCMNTAYWRLNSKAVCPKHVKGLADDSEASFLKGAFDSVGG